jgi:hypothetical protein
MIRILKLIPASNTKSKTAITTGLSDFAAVRRACQQHDPRSSQSAPSGAAPISWSRCRAAGKRRPDDHVWPVRIVSVTGATNASDAHARSREARSQSTNAATSTGLSPDSRHTAYHA